MPDSTSVNGISGHNDAPVISLGDKAAISDIYAFTKFGHSDAGATAAVNPIEDSYENVPNNTGFEVQTGLQINLSGSEPDTGPVSASLPDDERTSLDSGGLNSDAEDEVFDRILRDLYSKSSDEASATASDTSAGANTPVGDNAVNSNGRHSDDEDMDGGSDTNSANTSPPHDGTAALNGRGQTPLSVDDLGAALGYPIIGIDIDIGSGLLPGGFPNGSRFGDDVLDIEVIAAVSGFAPQVGMGGSADAGAVSGSAPLGDFPYQINLGPGTTGLGPNPAAGVGEGFADDDPEDLGDGELIL